MSPARIAAALAVALALAAPAVAAPPMPVAPAEGEVVTTMRPAFSWSAGTSAVPIDHYEVLAVIGGQPVVVAQTPPAVTSARAALDLPDDTDVRWFVRLVSRAGGTSSTPPGSRPLIRVATPPAAPALTEVPGSGAPGARAFSWAGDRVASRWAVLNDAGAAVRSGDAPAASGRADVEGLADGAYVFRVVQLNAAGAEGAPVTRGFTVDATPPAALAPAPAGGQGFAWTGAEPGAIATWRVTAPDGSVVAGPADTAAARAEVGTIPPGRYAFEVRQTDAAGNAGPWGTVAFQVRGAVAARTPARSRDWRRATAKLHPRAGARVATRRPVLRWRPAPGAVLYNVQVYRLLPGGRLRKVVSGFPAHARYVVRRRDALVPGACYVWRVWPYRDGAYAPSPVGVSDLCVRARTRPA